MPQRIIIALGNPGEQYAKSRHNAAWLLLNKIIPASDWQVDKKLKALTVRHQDILFAKPLTYMNLSGESAVKILSYFQLLPKKLALFIKKDSDLSDVLTVIHDDLDLNLGDYKISLNSRSAGHKGVQSIIDRLGTKNFKRLRLGIKTPDLNTVIPAEKFVLQKFSSTELETLLNNCQPALKEII